MGCTTSSSAPSVSSAAPLSASVPHNSVDNVPINEAETSVVVVSEATNATDDRRDERPIGTDTTPSTAADTAQQNGESSPAAALATINTGEGDSPQPQPPPQPQRVDGNVTQSNSSMSTAIPPLKKGFLLKEGHLIKNWKNRFFVLEKGVLRYFESSTDAYPYGVGQKGELILKDAEVTMNGNIVTIVRNCSSKSFSESGLTNLALEIRYPTEREEWLAAIRDHITYINSVHT